MSIIRRYDPWALLDNLFEQQTANREEDSFLSMGNWLPSVDIKNEDKRYLIVVDLPGIAPEDVHISVENNVMTIKGERKTEAKENKEGYSRIERVSGSFYRRFTLPDDVDADHVNAVSKNGVLEIEMPKCKEKGSRKIEVIAKE